MDNELIKREILVLLEGEDGLPLVELHKLLKEKNLIKNDVRFRDLRKLLEELEDEGLIEERHFGEDQNFRVDYSLEK